MKGLLFGGCSFTWGQGLYFYSDLPRQKYPLNEFTYRRDELTDAHIRYKDILRSPRLVANHFNTFEVVKRQNGGGEDETFEFLATVFNGRVGERVDHFVDDKFEYEDIEYIIIQTSQIWRNKFYFTLNGEEEFAFISWYNPEHSQNWEKLSEWMIENDKTMEEIIETHFKIQYDRFLKEVKFYEEKGIKVRFLCWETDFYDIIKNDTYLMKRFIPLTYGDTTYNTIIELHQEHKHLKIKYDVNNFGDNTPDDHHPSKECHQVIAQNIIKKIESEMAVI
jgi:hypothetical protein